MGLVEPNEPMLDPPIDRSTRKMLLLFVGTYGYIYSVIAENYFLTSIIGSPY